MRWLRPIKRRLQSRRLDAIAAELERIHDAVWAAEQNYGPIGASGNRPERPDPAWLREAAFRRSVSTRSPLRMHLHQDGYQILGYAVVEDVDQGTQLTHLVVHPDHQGKGIGRSLMKEAMDGMQRPPFILACYRFNTKALAFYRSFTPDAEFDAGEQFVFRYDKKP